MRLLLAQVSLTLEEEEVFADIINHTKNKCRKLGACLPFSDLQAHSSSVCPDAV